MSCSATYKLVRFVASDPPHSVFADWGTFALVLLTALKGTH
jgi:hypothetical protein